MRQNAPNPISISIFRGDTPGSPPVGALPQTPVEGKEGRGREGRSGREGRAGKGKGREGTGKEGEGKERVKFASLPLGDRRPWRYRNVI